MCKTWNKSRHIDRKRKQSWEVVRWALAKVLLLWKCSCNTELVWHYQSSHWCQSWVAGLAQVASPKGLGLQRLSCHTVANCKAGSWNEFCSNESKRYGFGCTVLGSNLANHLKKNQALAQLQADGLSQWESMQAWPVLSRVVGDDFAVATWRDSAFVGSWVLQPTIFSQNKMNISEIHSTRKNHSLKQMLLVLAALTAPSVLSAGLLLVLDKGIDGQTKHTHRYPSLGNLLILWWGGSPSRCKLARAANKLLVEAH